MKTVLIISKEGNTTSSQKVPVQDIFRLDDSFVDIANYLNDDRVGALFHFTHGQIKSLLNLTKVTPYTLVFFDEDLIFTGVTQSISNGMGDFAIQTQARFVLFVPLPHALQMNHIINIKIK